MKWNVRLTSAAQKQWLSIKDTRIREQIHKHIKGLENDPDKQGKPLGEDLYGYRSIRTVKQRYRIIHKLKNTEIIVLVVGVGIRKEGDKKDIYALSRKLARLGLLDLITLPAPDSADKPEEPEA